MPEARSPSDPSLPHEQRARNLAHDQWPAPSTAPAPVPGQRDYTWLVLGSLAVLGVLFSWGLVLLTELKGQIRTFPAMTTFPIALMGVVLAVAGWLVIWRPAALHLLVSSRRLSPASGAAGIWFGTLLFGTVVLHMWGAISLDLMALLLIIALVGGALIQVGWSLMRPQRTG